MTSPYEDLGRDELLESLVRAEEERDNLRAFLAEILEVSSDDASANSRLRRIKHVLKKAHDPTHDADEE